MLYRKTTALKKLQALNKRIRGVAGGTAASKTISIIQILIDKAQRDTTPTLTSITSESMPHLKRGCIKDFLDILKLHEYYNDDLWNKSDFTYTFETGSKIEFFSLDMPHKVRGPRRQRLFINEANNIPLETFDQLEVRTENEIWLDWNPTNEFWFYTDVLTKRDDVDFIILTYKDNEGLQQSIIESIEGRRENKNWWNVYGLGQLGNVEGKIYTDWQIIDEIPFEARLERYGLDFGYSNDPTAIIAVYKYNGGLILDEITYQKGLSNKQIADILMNQNRALVIADSAEPKSIDELISYGVNVQPSLKGQGSILKGIQYVQQQRISVTKRSISCIKEYRNYLWQIDPDGKITNNPGVVWNHCLVGNTLVDTVDGQIKIKDLVGKQGYLYSENGKIRKFYNVRKMGVEQIYEIEFTNGTKVSCSSEHPLKLENGDWCPASLLLLKDKIQLATYESNRSFSKKANIQWKKLLLWKRKVFSWKSNPYTIRFNSSGLLDISQRQYTEGISYSSQGWRLETQSDRKLRNKIETSAFKRTHDASEETTSKRMDRKDKTSSLRMARITTRLSLSFDTWQDIMAKERKDKKKLLTLWQRVRYLYWDKVKVLPPELQNESETTQVKRITRKSYKRAVYNLEVEDTHSFSINGGIIVSNCMDSIRYAVNSLIPSDPQPIPIYRKNKWAI